MRSEERWLLLSDGARPTEDIYFLESVEWQRCITWLLEHPHEARRMAEAAAERLRREK